MWVRRDAATAFARKRCIRSSTHRSLFVHLCEPRCTSTRLCSATFLRGERHFSIGESDRPSHQILAQNLTTWAIGFSIRFDPVRFRKNIGLHKKTDLFFRSKSKNLKLEIRSHKDQPYFDVKMWRYRVDVVTEAYGTGIDVVPIPVPTPVRTSIPVPEVPISTSYRTYRIVRYRY